MNSEINVMCDRVTHFLSTPNLSRDIAKPIHDIQIIYYDPKSTKFDYWNKLDFRCYSESDMTQDIKRYCASLQKFGKNQSERLQRLISLSQEKQGHFIIKVNRFGIEYVRRYDSYYIKFYINSLACEKAFPDPYECRSWMGILDKFNFFDKKNEGKHIAVLHGFPKPELEKEIKDHIRMQGIECKYDSDRSENLLIFADQMNYHLFALAFKNQIKFNADCIDYREKVFEQIALKDIDPVVIKEAIKMYCEADVKFKK